MTPTSDQETLTHRLILPRDANHHGTLYAGVLLTLALEAGYATAYRAAGLNANLVLKRVLDLRAYQPVQIGKVIEIRGREIHRARAQIVVGLYGSPLSGERSRPGLDSAMQFVQIDEHGRPEPLEEEPKESFGVLADPWQAIRLRALKLLAIRS